MQARVQSVLHQAAWMGTRLEQLGQVNAPPPGGTEPVIQPLISAYWSWSGIVESIPDNVKKQPLHDVTDATLYAGDANEAGLRAGEEAGMAIASGVVLARDLVNRPGYAKTPAALADDSSRCFFQSLILH